MAPTLEDLQRVFTPLAVQGGLACLIAQCLLYLLLKQIDRYPSLAGPWSRRAGFTAHQIVTLPMLTYLTVEGLRLWLLHPSEDGGAGGATPAERLLGDHPASRHLSEICLGVMFFWDVPTSILTGELRQPAMVLHHLAMFGTAACALGALSGGRPLMGHYASFYFGAIELSSLPLLVVDVFHPKHEDWHAWLTKRPDAPAWLEAVNTLSRTGFAVLFLLVRTLWFPYVSFLGVLRDVVALSEEEDPAAPDADAMFGLYVMAGLNVFFSCLQLYWGRMVLRQVVKVLFPAGGKKKAE